MECPNTRDQVLAMKPRRVFSNKGPIVSADFGTEGKTLFTTNECNHISVYDLATPECVKVINSHVYGCGEIAAGPHPDVVFVSSTKRDHNIRYLSLHDNKYIRTFPAHTDRVVSIAMMPTKEGFVTTGMDNNVFMWDVRTKHYTAKLEELTMPSVAAIDPEGLVTAIGVENNRVKLYDIRQLECGPFQTFEVPNKGNEKWTHLEFSVSGAYIMVGTNGSSFTISDAFNASVVSEITGIPNARRERMRGTFASDENLVLCGGDDRKLRAFDTCSGESVAELDTEGKHTSPITRALFNPYFHVLATLASEVVLWQ